VGIGVTIGIVERVATGAVAVAGVGGGTENKLQLTSVTASVAIPRIHLLSMVVHLDWNIDTSVVWGCGSSVAEKGQVRGNKGDPWDRL
jgi:hypothetical protein